MRLPSPRGELSQRLVDLLGSESPPVMTVAGVPTDEDDLHLTLWMLHELHYRGFDEVSPALEWDPDLLRLRLSLERHLETWLRDLVAPDIADAVEQGPDLVTRLEHLTREQPGELATYLHREGTAEWFQELLVQRSVYHLKEADPHAWTLPRLGGRAKVALAELLYDEYGAGVPDRLHSRLYADALASCGLDPAYGAYLDRVPWQTLAVNNAMSLFGLNRRLRGASMGHLAAFEMTSSLPCRRLVQAVERLELGEAVQRYFDEHVEADAVHEQLAAHDICEALVADEPALADDVLLGAAACVRLDGLAAQQMLDSWSADRSSLRAGAERSAA